MDIDQLQAGRELDALVAKKVINFPYTKENGALVLLPNYSTDIAAAWQVVEKVKELHQVCLALEDFQFDGKYWQALFKGEFDEKQYKWTKLDYAFADTAPLAICRAALKVMSG